MTEKLYSFDVFDTLITRRTATPEGIFALMQKSLPVCTCRYSERIMHNFFILRREAEKVARNTYITEEVKDISLQQIYECFLHMEDLEETQLQELMDLEVAIESENILPIPENIERLSGLKEMGERVVLISNMYLNSEVIRKLLLQSSPVFQEIPIYVSGDLGKTKGTRTLYHYVREQEQIQFSDWYHYGDNWDLDVKIPRSLGIHAEHYKRPGLLGWEKELLSERENNANLQLLLGISQNTRRLQEIQAVSLPYQVGCGFSAVLLLPYVIWVLQQSRKRAIKKLFFIARDGYVLKKIADILIAGYNLPIETSYLYGSRKAWRLPSVEPGNFDLPEFFRWNYPGEIRSYTQIAEIMELTFEELRRFLPFAREEKKELSWPLVQEILQILAKEQKELAAYIYGKQTEKREAVKGYLRQEIADATEDYAFVDLIGSGYTQRCLADLMKTFCNMPVKTFFYRLDCCNPSGKNENLAFFPNRIKMGNLIEVLCGAPHGQTNGYEYKEGHWIPILGEDEGVRLVGYGFTDYVKGIEDYTKEMVSCFPGEMLGFQDLDVPVAYLEYMADARNRQLYDYIARMPYGITGKEQEVVSFAPQVLPKDMRNLYLWHKGEPERRYYKGYSMDYSLICLSERHKKRLEFYRKHSDDAVIKWLRKHFFQSEARVCTSRYHLIADKIILYGAGKRGRLLYQQLTAGKQYHAEIVLWVDRNYVKHQEEGLQVHSPEDIAGVDYQQIVIGLADRRMAEEIRENLIDKGIASASILWIKPDVHIC